MQVEKCIRVGLVGNPNVGKSTVFNSLTKMKQHTGNWPGKTVESAVGYFTSGTEKFEIIDLPGTYSIFSRSKEEEVTRDFILKKDAYNYDAIVVVCDAVCLERNLNLVLQIKEITSKVIVAINLIDEAKKKGIHIDYENLSKALDVPVIPICARDKLGIEELVCMISKVAKNNEQKETNAENSDNSASQIDMECEEIFLKEATRIIEDTVVFEKKRVDAFDRKIDKVLTNKFSGILIMALLLTIIFWITIAGANYPSEILFDIFGRIEVFLYKSFDFIGVPKVLANFLIAGGFKVLSWVVAVMLPPMAIFFPLFTILEDLGILPRIAFNLDNVFRKCGACGKQALTMCMGFGCNACGVAGARIIDSPRERLLAIITNSFVPCNGRFPTIIALLSLFFIGINGGVFGTLGGVLIFVCLIFFSVIATLLVSKILSKTFLKGESSSFILELPPYRIPKFGSVIVRSIFDKTIYVLWRAMLVAFPAGIIIWLLSNVHVGNLSIISYMVNLLDPLAKIMGMDGAILTAFILGFPANEIVLPIALMIYNSTGELMETGNLTELCNVLLLNGWTIKTAICVIMFSLMHWPCSTTCLTIHKETKSLKWTLLGIVIPTICGMIVCIIINFLFGLLMNVPKFMF